MPLKHECFQAPVSIADDLEAVLVWSCSRAPSVHSVFDSAVPVGSMVTCTMTCTTFEFSIWAWFYTSPAGGLGIHPKILIVDFGFRSIGVLLSHAIPIMNRHLRMTLDLIRGRWEVLLPFLRGVLLACMAKIQVARKCVLL